jgi:MutS domain V
MQTITNLYLERSERFARQSQALRKRYNRLSILRLAVFFGSIGLAILLWSVHWLVGCGFIMLALAGFYRLVQWHQGIQAEAEHLARLSAINAAEQAALGHDYAGFPNGADFLQPGHPYTLDLDLFGDYSFFQYTCRASTSIGQERLAQYLLAPAAPNEITARQKAVAELKPLLEWRQNFQALGADAKDDPRHLDMLRLWLQDEDLVRGNRLLIAALYIMPFWTLGALLLWAFYIPWPVFVLFLLPAAIILKKTTEKVNRIHRRTTHAADMLAQYGRLLHHIESLDFTAPKLARLKESLNAGNQSASRHLQRLAYIISQLNVRMNFFAIFFNIGALWDLRWVYRLEKWKARLHGQLPVWFEALREFEALSSFANLWHNNPGWVLPEIIEGARLEAANLGHPLIPAAKRIGNGLHMDTRCHIKLITGSNMAGKSTFLRTAGLNIVLAQAGAPVCAERFVLPPLQVFTSMRTQDALHESTSSFYAELKRLKVIIEAVKSAQTPSEGELPVFFLLDEILKGTNSVDRHTGSAALIRQLIRLQGSGLIATHDLELGSMEAAANGAIENLCMEVEIKDGQLFFDYKIEKGVSKSFNATLLMREMGIEVD